jgi:DNA-binding response OmpR family regulator
MLVVDINEPEPRTSRPALRPEEAPAGSTWSQDSWLTGQPVILVVDDDEDSRDTIATLLEGQDLSVIQASNGEAALRVAAALPVTAIVLDVVLPDLTGFDICRILREDPATRDVPVIMLTALTQVADEVTGVLAGANSYLVKPVSRQTLLQHLRNVI